jgi:acyl-CoA synthetase (NDP forming)
VPVTREALVRTASDARDAAWRIGYPIALKVCAAGEAHKTERGLVVVGLANDRDLRRAFATLRERAGDGYGGGFLVQEMVRGIGCERPDVAQIDVNPLIVRDDRPVAVDALVVLADTEGAG